MVQWASVTIFFPDVSSYTPNVDPAAHPVLIARATLSNRVTDTAYATFKQRAAAAHTVFVAYHWLNHGNLAAQAAHCYSVVGAGIPLMIDAEDEAGNTGYNGPLTVGDITGFAAQYRALGGTASLAYVPSWYWSGAMGAPDLTPLNAAGLHLVSSNYPTAGYSDNGPGWAPYGGVAPAQWQYTDTPIDMNAYRGTVADYTAMIGGKPVAFFDDPNAAALAYRMDALAAGADTVRGGPTQGEPMWLVQAVKNIQAKIATPTPVQVDASAVAAALAGNATFLAALAKAVNDDAARRLQS